MPHKTGHEDEFTSISAQRKRAIRAEMLRRWKQKLRKKGAAKAAGGDPKKTSGVDPKTGKKYGTGSMKGFGLTAKEIKYAQTVRKIQRKKSKADANYVIPGTKKTKKATAKTARATGAKNPKLVTAMSMKSKSKGGTVSKGSHKAVAGQKGGGAKRIAAKAWRTKHMKAAGTDKVKRAKIQKRFKHMIGK
jgi:hypothetical protein